ncbi:Autophagy-related protein 2 B [Nymphon striatum]|nr:Autophagy-related protein 2 B [Nymphon striatum]
MTSFISNFNLGKTISKRVIAVVLKHYIGDFLADRLNQDQLDFHLENGQVCVSVDDANLNVDTLNENAEKFNLPIEFVEFSLECLKISVPITKIHSSNVGFEARGIVVAVQPKKRADSALLEDMLQSMTSSIEYMNSKPQLKEEILREEIQEDIKLDGYDALNQFIESVQQKANFTCNDVTIKLQNFPNEFNSTSTLEIKLDWLWTHNKALIVKKKSETKPPNEDKLGDAFAELIQCLDDRSLSLVIREAKNDLQEHYLGKRVQEERHCEIVKTATSNNDTEEDHTFALKGTVDHKTSYGNIYDIWSIPLIIFHLSLILHPCCILPFYLHFIVKYFDVEDVEKCNSGGDETRSEISSDANIDDESKKTDSTKKNVVLSKEISVKGIRFYLGECPCDANFSESGGENSYLSSSKSFESFKTPPVSPQPSGQQFEYSTENISSATDTDSTEYFIKIAEFLNEQILNIRFY